MCVCVCVTFCRHIDSPSLCHPFAQPSPQVVSRTALLWSLVRSGSRTLFPTTLFLPLLGENFPPLFPSMGRNLSPGFFLLCDIFLFLFSFFFLKIILPPLGSSPGERSGNMRPNRTRRGFRSLYTGVWVCWAGCFITPSLALL